MIVIALLLAEDGNEAEAAKDEEAANGAEAAKAPCTTPKEHLFEGRVDGTIATEKRGTAGFGYDPLFVPDGYDQSFAQLGTDIKNTISHRARAVEKLCCFLKQTAVKNSKKAVKNNFVVIWLYVPESCKEQQRTAKEQ